MYDVLRYVYDVNLLLFGGDSVDEGAKSNDVVYKICLKVPNLEFSLKYRLWPIYKMHPFHVMFVCFCINRIGLTGTVITKHSLCTFIQAKYCDDSMWC